MFSLSPTLRKDGALPKAPFTLLCLALHSLGRGAGMQLGEGLACVTPASAGEARCGARHWLLARTWCGRVGPSSRSSFPFASSSIFSSFSPLPLLRLRLCILLLFLLLLPPLLNLLLLQFIILFPLLALSFPWSHQASVASRYIPPLHVFLVLRPSLGVFGLLERRSCFVCCVFPFVSCFRLFGSQCFQLSWLLSGSDQSQLGHEQTRPSHENSRSGHGHVTVKSRQCHGVRH
jgi:hypothetical protein